MKLFYFVDFTHIKNYGSPVTFDRYVKLEHGPIPTTIMNLVGTAGDDIEHSVLADTIDIQQPVGTQMLKIVPRRPLVDADLNLLSEAERKTLDQVCARFADKNTQYIEDASHKEAPWRESKMFSEISYLLATEDSDCKVSKEEVEMMLQISGIA